MVPLVAERLRSALGSARTVFEYAVPAGPLPERYLLVTDTPGVDDGERACGVVDARTPVLFVTSVARDDSHPARASREAGWGGRKVVDALASWRPVTGRPTNLCRVAATSPIRQDDSLPGFVAMQTIQATVTYQP